MALRIFNKSKEVLPDESKDRLDFLQRATLAAIKEYETIWCAKPRLDEKLAYHVIIQKVKVFHQKLRLLISMLF